jgi:hypothetical protein
MARKKVLAPRRRVCLMLDVKTIEALSILGSSLGENRSRVIELFVEWGLGGLLSDLKKGKGLDG